VIDVGSLEFAQARLQSRHGERADEPAWQRLEVAREFAALLDAGRQSPLQAWFVGITVQSTSHQIEAVLRGHWRAAVAEVAGWMPPCWQPALNWCAPLPDLPALQHLLRGGEPAPWMAEDPALHAACAAAPAERAAAIAAALTEGALNALAGRQSATESLSGSLMPAWRAEWQRRLAQPLGGLDDPLRQLVTTLQSHGATFAAASAGQGGLLRAALKARLSLLLRRAALEPAAAFIHLALCALDLERLRGELLLRVLFPRTLSPARVA
jgi:hypothetical protein